MSLGGIQPGVSPSIRGVTNTEVTLEASEVTNTEVTLEVRLDTRLCAHIKAGVTTCFVITWSRGPENLISEDNITLDRYNQKSRNLPSHSRRILVLISAEISNERLVVVLTITGRLEYSV